MSVQSSEPWEIMERADSKAHPADIHAGQSVLQPRCMAQPTQQQPGSKVGIKPWHIEKNVPATSRVSASRMWEIAAHMCRRYL